MLLAGARGERRSSFDSGALRLFLHFRFEFLAVDDGFGDSQRRRAALGAVATQGNGVAGLDGMGGPTGPDEMVGAGELALPLRDCAAPVLDVDRDEDVRIHEFEIRGSSGDSDNLFGVIRSGAVVGEE